MEKQTVLARLRLTLEFTPEAQQWLETLNPNIYWFAGGRGSSFLGEYGGQWRSIFAEAAEPEFRHFFGRLEIPREHFPRIEFGESYQGSWIMDAAIVMAGTVGTAYTVLKGASELPEIADGLSVLKNRILNKLRPRVNEEVRKQLTESVKHCTEQARRRNESEPTAFNLPDEVESDDDLTLPERREPRLLPSAPPPPPPQAIAVDFVIDARPLTSLSPSALKSHAIHLSVAISREMFTLENLGKDPLKDVKIGLFRTRTQRKQWSYGDSYTGSFALVSGGQTTAKPLGEFRDATGNRLDLSDGDAVHVDCWVQDSHGIYLFMFFLEEEK